MPAVVATCSSSGEPNVTYLSQVYFVDEGHVALSCQFFNKTAKNVAENPFACVAALRLRSRSRPTELDLRFDHSETAGPLFDDDGRAHRRDRVAHRHGGVFKLLSADVYEVLVGRGSIEGLPRSGRAPPATAPAGRSSRAPRPPGDLVHGSNRGRSLDALLATLLASARRRARLRARDGAAARRVRREALHDREPAATASRASAPRSRSARA